VLTLTNPGNSNITVSRFAFDAPYTGVDWIAADAALINCVAPSRSGDHFTVGSGWNPAVVIPAGGSLPLTFQASPGGSPPAPANLVINGVTVGNCGGGLSFVNISKQGNNIVLTWQTPGGTTNHLLAATTIISNLWTDISGPIIVSGNGTVSTIWTDVGGATNSPARVYRLRIP